MANEEKKTPEQETAEETREPETGETQPAGEAAGGTQPADEAAAEPQPDAQDALRDTLAQQEEKYLRLAAEYDNYRKRSAKEKESAWTDAKADTAAAFLPVYDNLERALKAPCGDEAFLKGVEMTMTQLKDVLSKLGIEEIPAQGEQFDPALHNAVMHIEDEAVEKNTITEVFQTGFRIGEKVIRFAMVKVAN